MIEPAPERPRPGGVRDQRREIERHVDARFGAAERLSIEIDHQRQVHLAAVPGFPQFVRRHRDRRKGARGLALEEAEALGEFAGDEAAQGHVVDQHDQPDGVARLVGRGAHGHVVDNNGDLAFHVDAPGLVLHADRLARIEKGIGAALIHQRIGPEALRHLGAAGPAHEFNVIDVGRAVRPLVGTRERRHGVVLVEALVRHRAMLEAFCQRRQMRRNPQPVVECGLHGRRQERGIGAARKIG